MARLDVNKEGIKNEFLRIFFKNLSLYSETLKNDIDKRKKSVLGIKQEPEVFIALKQEVDKVSISIKSNVAFVLDNYGTGSLMSLDNPALAKYKANSELWNPDRKGNFITGRKKGTYTNIVGKRKSSGRYRGKSLEGRILKVGKKHNLIFKPHKPSGALEKAIYWFYQSFLKRCWEKTIKELNISKYLTFK